MGRDGRTAPGGRIVSWTAIGALPVSPRHADDLHTTAAPRIRTNSSGPPPRSVRGLSVGNVVTRACFDQAPAPGAFGGHAEHRRSAASVPALTREEVSRSARPETRKSLKPETRGRPASSLELGPQLEGVIQQRALDRRRGSFSAPVVVELKIVSVKGSASRPIRSATHRSSGQEG